MFNSYTNIKKSIEYLLMEPREFEKILFLFRANLMLCLMRTSCPGFRRVQCGVSHLSLVHCSPPQLSASDRLQTYSKGDPALDFTMYSYKVSGPRAVLRLVNRGSPMLPVLSTLTVSVVTLARFSSDIGCLSLLLLSTSLGSSLLSFRFQFHLA